MTEEYVRALRGNILAIRETMAEAALRAGRRPEEILLCAACKTRSPEEIRASAQLPVDCFGENHAQELERNWLADAYVHDAEGRKPCHFIGHLQTNKVKYIAPYITMIEAVDSLRLLREIQKQAAKVGRVVKVLLELHIAEEATKYGLTLDECRQLLADGEWRQMPNVRICGLMMMASNTDDEQQIACEFQQGADFFDEVKAQFFADDPHFCERSWGMSDDFPIAVQHRSTMVRVGTMIFGPRVY